MSIGDLVACEAPLHFLCSLQIIIHTRCFSYGRHIECLSLGLLEKEIPVDQSGQTFKIRHPGPLTIVQKREVESLRTPQRLSVVEEHHHVLLL